MEDKLPKAATRNTFDKRYAVRYRVTSRKNGRQTTGSERIIFRIDFLILISANVIFHVYLPFTLEVLQFMYFLRK